MYYSLSDFQRDIVLLYDRIDWDKYDSICPVVQGGVPVAMALSARAGKPVVDEARAKSLIVDDLIDSGQTREAYSDYDFACLHIKESTPPNISDENATAAPIIKIYQLARLSRGNATSLAPICIGIIKLPKKAGIPGITTIKTIMAP